MINVMDNIRVNIMVAKDFNPEENSLLNIVEKVVRQERISFCIYMTIRFLEKMKDGEFVLRFDLIKLPEDDSEKTRGFLFAIYKVGNEDEETSLKNVQKNKVYVQGRWDKVITVKKFSDLPLDGPGKYAVLVSWAEQGLDEMPKKAIDRKKVLDSWQFEVV